MNNSTPIALPTMASVADAAAASGLPESLIRKLIQTGTIKHVRSGRKIYVNVDSLSEYLATGDDPQQPTLADYPTHQLEQRSFTEDEAKN